MVRHHRSATTPAALAAATLLVTACGGDDSPSSDDKIEGAGQSSPAALPTEPDAGPEDAEPEDAGPEIELPGSVELVFKDWEPDDPEEQAVLDSGAQSERATYEAITQDPPNPDSEYVASYHVKGTGAWTDTQDWIDGFKDANATVEGKVRFRSPVVEVHDNGTTGSLRYCADESGVETVERESGKVLSAAKPGDVVQYDLTLQKSDDDVWQVAGVNGKRGSCDE
ncbi:hypothetical protein CXR04_10785 [Streptomyces sp. CMB-StM0423]|nr:hypothetical protein CXR04_10785 [Streptomyces sp. CMB-StM0423]